MYTEGTSTVKSSLYLGNRAFIYYYLQLTAVKQVSQLTTGSLRCHYDQQKKQRMRS